MLSNSVGLTTLNPIEEEKIRRVILAIHSDVREDIIQSTFYDYEDEIMKLNGSHNKEFEKYCKRLYENWDKHFYQD